jgi:superfamily II DNA or RNA helicase
VAKKTEWNYGDFLFAAPVRFIIFDEVHRASAIDSLNEDMLTAAYRQNKMVLGLSATAANSPLKMNALGYMLGLHSGGSDFYRWARSLGCRKPDGMPGFRWMVSEAKQQDIMRKINAAIVPARGVRVRTSEIPNFPTRTISAELYDIEGSEKIDSLYSQMREPLAALESRAAGDIAPESAPTKTLRAWQRIELLKVPLALELAADFREKGLSVAFFCNFSATIDELAKRLNTNCIIDGRPEHNRPGLRSSRVARFQHNEDRNIILNNQAGNVSIGLQDLTGNFPRVGVVFPCYSAEAMIQIFGRLPRDGGKSHSHYVVLFAANTGEKSMARAIRAKSNNIECLNNGDCNPENFRLTTRSY